MNEMKVVRGTDIMLYADDKPLFGVLSFSAAEKRLYHEIYEYLSIKPCERVPQGSVYEIKLSLMALFDHQLPSQPGFSLCVADGDEEYRYENCRIIGQQSELKGSEYAAEVFTVEADSFTKAVIGG